MKSFNPSDELWSLLRLRLKWFLGNLLSSFLINTKPCWLDLIGMRVFDFMVGIRSDGFYVSIDTASRFLSIFSVFIYYRYSLCILNYVDNGITICIFLIPRCDSNI